MECKENQVKIHKIGKSVRGDIGEHLEQIQTSMAKSSQELDEHIKGPMTTVQAGVVQHFQATEGCEKEIHRLRQEINRLKHHTPQVQESVSTAITSLEMKRAVARVTNDVVVEAQRLGKQMTTLIDKADQCMSELKKRLAETKRLASELDMLLFLQILNLEKWSQQLKSNSITFENIHESSTVVFMNLTPSGMAFSEGRYIVTGLREISTTGVIPEIVNDESLNGSRVKSWTIANVESYFRTKQLSSIAQCIADHQINGLVLMSLDDNDIAGRGLVGGDQIILKREVKALKDLRINGRTGEGTGGEHPSKMRFSREIPTGFKCPITQSIMLDPVVAEDGHSYERQAIESWLQSNRTSPVTGVPMPSKLLSNAGTKKMIEEWIEQHRT
jgi:hypothetical protein